MKEGGRGRGARLRRPPGAGRDRAPAVPSPRVSSAPGNLPRAHYAPGAHGVVVGRLFHPAESAVGQPHAPLKCPRGLFVFASGGTVAAWRERGGGPGDLEG